MRLTERLIRQLEQRKENGTFRSLCVKEGLIDFTSNDYLGFARSQQLSSMIQQKLVTNCWNGATGSRLLSGNSEQIEETEKFLAQIFRSEHTLIFNSGYSANLAVLSSLPQRGDTILYDELSHASIKDGLRLSLAKRYSFKHNDLADLEHHLKSAQGNIYIVVESVYSMDGDFCPLKEMVSLAEQYGAYIILDEAHATGIMGAGGGGLSEYLGLEDRIAARIYTFGKAMGIHGAAVACSNLIRDYLVNFSRPFIYTTALSPHSVAAIHSSFTFLGDNKTVQDELFSKVRYFNEKFRQKLGNAYRKTSEDHPIQAILIPGNEAATSVAKYLQKAGYDVRPILSPTVKVGEERLRICLHTFNSNDDISGLIDSLAALKREKGKL